MVEVEMVRWYSLVEYKLGPGRVLSFSPVPELVIRFINHVSTVSLHIKVNLIISDLIPVIAYSKDVAIRIDSIHSANVVQISSHDRRSRHQGQWCNRPNENGTTNNDNNNNNRIQNPLIN